MFSLTVVRVTVSSSSTTVKTATCIKPANSQMSFYRRPASGGGMKGENEPHSCERQCFCGLTTNSLGWLRRYSSMRAEVSCRSRSAGAIQRQYRRHLGARQAVYVVLDCECVVSLGVEASASRRFYIRVIVLKYSTQQRQQYQYQHQQNQQQHQQQHQRHNHCVRVWCISIYSDSGAVGLVSRRGIQLTGVGPLGGGRLSSLCRRQLTHRYRHT